MSTSTNGILAYGYDLGGDEEWKLEGLGEFGELPELSWYDPEDEDGDDFQSAAETRLLAEVAGFAEEYPRGEPEDVRRAYFDRKKQAGSRVGVEIESYCSGDYPRWLLTTKAITVHRGGCETIDMAQLVEAPILNDWDAKLAAAVQALGITPVQDRPKWLLVSYMG